MDLSETVLAVLEKRYLLKNESGQVVETPDQMLRRVAAAVAAAETAPGAASAQEEWGERFYEIMSAGEFLPNSPTLMNAGTSVGQLSACFVVPVGDSISEIFEALKDMAVIHQSGGGTGFGFSRLRPEGDVVQATHGIASGPLSFMKVFDTATTIIKQGGRRRGANMGILRVDHPDIFDFVEAKKDKNALNNFNLSVAVTDSFMDAAVRGLDFELINPKTRLSVKTIKAAELLDRIAEAAWRTGDPGLFFIDEANRHNPTPALGAFESTNPCGEQPLLPFESCNLGSLNLASFVSDGTLDSDRLAATVRTAVRFLDDVIDVNNFPLAEVAKMTRANRKIGLGVMGLAEALVKLGISYGSPESFDFAGHAMRYIQDTGRDASINLAHERGSFPNFAKSVFKSRGITQIRNATVTTVAPTGTISLIAGTSSGIEPYFALSYTRRALDGREFKETNRLYAEMAAAGLDPAELKRLFPTALTLEPEAHVRMQAAFQMYTDNAVSKTVNLRADSELGDVKHIFRLAYELKCKGITVYRYGSKGDQVLYLGPDVDSPDDCRAHVCPA